jgi:hypothetical protein
MPGVAVAQLPLNVTHHARILVNGDKHGARRLMQNPAIRFMSPIFWEF